MRRLAVIVLALLVVSAPPLSAQEDIAEHEYLFSAADLDDLLGSRPTTITDVTGFAPEGSPSLQIFYTTTAVVGVWIGAVWTGEVATCPSRLWFSATQDEIEDLGNSQFLVTMGGSWDWSYTTRAAPQDACRAKVQIFEPFSFDLTVTLNADAAPTVAQTLGAPLAASAPTPTTGADLTPEPNDAARATEATPATEAAPATEGDSTAVSLTVLLTLILVAVAVAGWVGYAVVKRYISKIPSMPDGSGHLGLHALETVSEVAAGLGATDQAEPGATDQVEPAEEGVPDVFLHPSVGDTPMPPEEPPPPSMLLPGCHWVWVPEAIGVEIRSPGMESMGILEPGSWYQARPNTDNAEMFDIYTVDGVLGGERVPTKWIRPMPEGWGQAR